MQAELKSVFSELTSDGTTMAAVVRLKNISSKVTRVPDYELRVTTSDGVSYTLSPSVDNPRSIQAKGKVELSYMLTVDRTDKFSLKKLNWVHIDEYVYPRKETTLLSMDISAKVWQGPETELTPSNIKKWGESFKLDTISQDVTFTPSSLQRQNTTEGLVTVITVSALNNGKEKVFIPEFVISGTDGQKLYEGEKADNNPVSLKAGEAANLYFAIPTDTNVQFNELVVMTPEHFVSGNSQTGRIDYHIGRLSIDLPESRSIMSGLDEYKYDTPIKFDLLNELINKDVQVSLMELHMHENGDDGYQTAIAKFKLRNDGKLPLPIPAFQAELTSQDGYTYSGIRQNLITQNLMPGLSHVISYSFNVSNSEEGDKFALKLLDSTTSAPFSSEIAKLAVTVQKDMDEKIWNLYPFNVTMRYWTLGAVADSIPVVSYSYKLVLDLDIQRTENVVVDRNFSKLKIELADNLGRTLGSETIPFTGINPLVSGKQTIRFNNIRSEQIVYPVTIRFYEVIDTPNGEASRLIHTLKQR